MNELFVKLLLMMTITAVLHVSNHFYLPLPKLNDSIGHTVYMIGRSRISRKLFGLMNVHSMLGDLREIPGL